ncbi:MAG: hypothetical protein ACPG4N_00870 [Gammaproteobacteria bacterium]
MAPQLKAVGTDDDKKSTDQLDRFLTTFERSAKRWEYVVYPALFAFIVLAAYGFFLIYSLTSDMHRMAAAIDPNMGEHLAQMTTSMGNLNTNVQIMTAQIQEMSSNIDTMNTKMSAMSELKPMSYNIASMKQSMDSMDGSMDSIRTNMGMMRHDMANMTHQVARPMSMFNSFMPW